MERDDLLSLLWIAGLGEPSYWRFEAKALAPITVRPAGR